MMLPRFKVGAYLPQSSSAEGLYVFHASADRTPALRAGALEQYTVSLPADWKEVGIFQLIFDTSRAT
jgi:hypothetical protein